MKHTLLTIAILSLASQSFAISHECKVTEMRNAVTPSEELLNTEIVYPAQGGILAARFQIQPVKGTYISCGYDNRFSELQLTCETTVNSKIVSRSSAPASSATISQFNLTSAQLGYQIDCALKK